MSERVDMQIWAEKKDGRARVMIQIEGEAPFEMLSVPEGFRQDLVGIIPLPEPVYPTDK